MPQTRYRLPATAALLVGFAVVCFIILLTALNGVGTDGELYYNEQLREAVPADAELCDAALRVLDGQLADYLKGDAEALKGAPFNDRELTHLRDCFDLFELLRRVRARLIPWAIVLTLGGAYALRDRRLIRRCAWLGPLLLLLPLGAFALYAALNFDAAFTLFHRVLFRNDLWLLDPRTDLLIRICPEGMFMRMGARIAVYSLIGIVAVSAAVTLLTFLWPKGKEDKNAWKTTTRRGPAPKQITFGSRGMR